MAFHSKRDGKTDAHTNTEHSKLLTVSDQVGAVQEEELLPVQNSMTDSLMGIVTLSSISQNVSQWHRRGCASLSKEKSRGQMVLV